MKVLVPKRSFFGKILGSALLAMTMSVSANAMSEEDSFDNLGSAFDNANFGSDSDSSGNDNESSEGDSDFTSVIFENTTPCNSFPSGCSAPSNSQQAGQTQSITQCSGQQQAGVQEQCSEQILAKTQDIDQCTEKDTCSEQKDTIVQNTKDIIVESKKAIIEEKKDLIVEQKQEPVLACKKDTKACVEEKKTCQSTTIQQNTCNVQQTCQTGCSYGANLTTMDLQASAQVFEELHWKHLHARGLQKSIKGRNLSNVVLQGVNISNTDATKAIFNNVAMYGNFHDFDVNAATLTNVTFGNPSMKISAKLKGLTIKEKLKDVKTRKLTRVKNAKYLGFRNFEAKGAQIECAVFENAFFQHRWKNQNTFENATIRNTKFINNIFDGVSFEGVKFYNVCMSGSVYTSNASFKNAKYCTSDKDGDKCVPLTAHHLVKMGAVKTHKTEI